jgi:hypothetical protein
MKRDERDFLILHSFMPWKLNLPDFQQITARFKVVIVEEKLHYFY